MSKSLNNSTAGYDAGDAVQEYMERDREMMLQSMVFQRSKVDHTEMPLLEVQMPEGDISRFAVSRTEGFLQLKADLMQLGSQAPVGQFVIQNWPRIKIGDKLPNGGTVIGVGTITLPPDFEPLEN